MAALPNDSTHAFDANGYTLEQFQQDCAAQLSRAQVPPPYWRSIYDKLRFQVFDAGHSFGFSPISEDDVTGPMSLAAAVELHKDDPTNVWIVDHAWTFTVATAATSLRNDEQLRRRVSAMLIGDSAATMHASYVEWIIQETLDNLWKRARNYTIDGVHGASTVWYLADEVGTAVLPTTSTEDANVAFAALYFPPLQTAFDVMWLTQDVGEGEMVMFDVTRGVSQQYRHFHPKFALVWAGGEEEEEIQGICLAKYLMHLDVVKERNAVAAGRLEMVAAGGTHADLVAAATAPPRPELKGGTVFCDDVAMRRHLERGDKYVFTESMGDATIVWLRRAVRGSSLSALAPTATFVSQFNNEVELTHEARRSRCVHQQLGEPAWQPLVFPANEIDLFVGHLQHASQVAQETLLRRSAQAATEVPPAKGPLKPAWCVRPSGRGVSFATTSMDLLLRSGEERNDDPESEAGPSCISEFVRSCDTLSDGRKYSLQFFVLVHSFAPLKAFVVNRYWLRVAQQPLSHDTDECDMLDEAVHITRTRLNMHPEDFEASFNERHGDGRWQATLGDCHQALFELFAAVDLQVGKSMAVRGNFAGTVYRAEVIMAASATTVTPRIVSIDACPDMTRQNDDDPRFFGTLFDALFCCGDADPSFATRLTHRAAASQHRVGGDAVTHVD